MELNNSHEINNIQTPILSENILFIKEMREIVRSIFCCDIRGHPQFPSPTSFFASEKFHNFKFQKEMV